MKSRAKPTPLRRERSISCAMRSRKRRRLGRQVSGSKVGITTDGFLELLAVADIGQETDITLDLAELACHRIDAGKEGHQLAGGTSVHDFTGPLAVVLQPAPQLGMEHVVMHAGDEQGRATTQHLLFAVAQQLTEGGVDADHVERRIRDDDGLPRRAEHHGCQLLFAMNAVALYRQCRKLSRMLHAHAASTSLPPCSGTRTARLPRTWPPLVAMA